MVGKGAGIDMLFSFPMLPSGIIGTLSEHEQNSL